MSINNEQTLETLEYQQAQQINLLSLPNELIEKIAKFVVERSLTDGRCFFLANKRCASITEPYLYSKVDLQTGQTFPGKYYWRTIAARPELGRYCRIFYPREHEIDPRQADASSEFQRGKTVGGQYLVSVSVFRHFPNVREFSLRPYLLGAGIGDEMHSGYQIIKHALKFMPLLEKLDIQNVQDDLDFTKLMEWLSPLTRLRVLKIAQSQWDDSQDMSKDFIQAALSRCSKYRGTGHATTVDYNWLPNFTWIANYVAWPRRLEDLTMEGLAAPVSNELEESWTEDFRNALEVQRDNLKSLTLSFEPNYIPDVSWLPNLEEYRPVHLGEFKYSLENLCEKVFAAPNLRRIIFDMNSIHRREATWEQPMISIENIDLLRTQMTQAHYLGYELEECRFCLHADDFNDSTLKGVAQLAEDMKDLGIDVTVDLSFAST